MRSQTSAPTSRDAELGQLLDGDVRAAASAAEPDGGRAPLGALGDEGTEPHPPPILEDGGEDRPGPVHHLEPRTRPHAEHALEVPPIRGLELEQLARRRRSR